MGTLLHLVAWAPSGEVEPQAQRTEAENVTAARELSTRNSPPNARRVSRLSSTFCMMATSRGTLVPSSSTAAAASSPESPLGAPFNSGHLRGPLWVTHDQERPQGLQVRLPRLSERRSSRTEKPSTSSTSCKRVRGQVQQPGGEISGAESIRDPEYDPEDGGEAGLCKRGSHGSGRSR